MPTMHDQLNTVIQRGYLRVYPEGHPEAPLYEHKNTICLNSGYLFARLMAATAGDTPVWPTSSVWGLALGAGAPDWPANSQPDALPTQQAILTPLLRKRLSTLRYVDSDLNPIPNNGLSKILDVQTTINATTDGLTLPIRELGLIGGGSSQTDFLNTPLFDSSTQNGINTVADPILINYLTTPPMKLPEGITFIFSWILYL